MNEELSLSAIEKSIWDLLHKGAENSRHPYHNPVICTVKDEVPRSRIVILRSFDLEKKQLLFHTDTRSAKVEEIKKSNYCNWHFFDRKSKTQLRVITQSTLHIDDEFAREFWDKSSLGSKKIYLAPILPGSELESFKDNFPPELDKRNVEQDQVDEGYKNFCLVSSRIISVEYLKLQMDGHVRAKFYFKDGILEKSTWLAA